MSNEKKYLYRILIGLILLLTNNEFTWKIIEYFARFNERFGKIFSISNVLLVCVSLIGLIITLVNTISLFKETLKN